MSQQANFTNQSTTWKQRTKRYTFPALSIFLGLTISAFMFFSHKPQDYTERNSNLTLGYANYVVSSLSSGLTVTYILLMLGTVWRKQQKIKQITQRSNEEES